MQSAAVSPTSSASNARISRRLVWALLGVGIAANTFVVVGGVWDAAYHKTYKADTFWSPPHIMLYSGMLLTLLIGFAVLALIFLRSPRRDGFVAMLAHRPLLLLPVIANAGFIATGPFDDLWHRAFGRDMLTTWTVPHALLALNVAATAVSVVALALWLRAEHPASDLAAPPAARSLRPIQVSLFLGLMLLIIHMWPFLSDWEHDQGPRTLGGEGWPYMLLAPAVSAFCFAQVARLFPGHWWVVALAGLVGLVWRQVPSAMFFAFGLEWGFRPDLIAAVGGCFYSLILWAAPAWPLWKRHALFGIVLVAAILLVRLFGQLHVLTTGDIWGMLPLMPLAAVAGGYLGDALARGLLHLTHQAPLNKEAEPRIAGREPRTENQEPVAL